ncbi:MAG TPA: methylated-DNA--[protein]-cysteine S-methyltransferase [Candidatus Limnocylindria bacterium]|nr:methylated-DNA--[protein]-cysteine S-methyltransferase [Candidatus Limnocylindria bacterium]
MSGRRAATLDADRLLADARERLVSRARREGLETVGYRVMDSPLGPLWIAVGPRGVLAIHYGAEPSAPELARIVRTYGPGVLPDARRADPVAREIDEYFAGKRRSFDVPVDLAPLTDFQRRILRATAAVAYGDVATYARVAAKAGNEKASRAAGQALGANPIPIVVPCHRVVATDGTLGGYAGGLDAKRRLLALEGGTVPPGGWPKKRRA